MKMSFKTFEGGFNHRKSSHIRVRDNACMYYGCRFMEDNGIDKFKDLWVVLSYDLDKKRIGFRFSDGEQEYAIKVRSNQRHMYVIRTKSFFKWMRINHKESRAYSVKSDGDGMFYIEIKEDEDNG